MVGILEQTQGKQSAPTEQRDLTPRARRRTLLMQF
jgi:hypothetical protein